MKEKIKRYIELFKETKHYLLNPLGIHYLLEDVRLSEHHAREYYRLYIGKVTDTPAYQAMAKETEARKKAMDEMERQYENDMDELEGRLSAATEDNKEFRDLLTEIYAQNAQLCADRAAALAETAYLRALSTMDDSCVCKKTRG